MDGIEIDWPQVLGPLLSKGAEGIAPEEVDSLQECLFSYSPRALRVHPSHRYPLPFAVQEIPWFEQGYWVEENVRPGSWLHHAAGDYYVQDAGSMLALALCEIQPGQTVVDTCAAPGGKASGILELLQGRGSLIANEVISSRLSQLQICLERTGFANFLVMNLELENLASLLNSVSHQECDGLADCVLIDAPCSGQSMVAKGKQKLSSFAPKQIEHNAARQRKLVKQAARMVKPGGRMVYSTCTFAFDENESIIQGFCQDNPGWTPVQLPALKEWELSGWPGCYRLWPHRDRCAGSFVAGLEKPAVEEAPAESSLDFRRDSKWQPWEDVRAAESDLNLGEQPGCYFTKTLSMRASQKSRAASLRELHYFSGSICPAWIPHCFAGSRWAEQKEAERGRKQLPWEPLFASAKLLNAAIDSALLLELDEQQAVKFVGGEAFRLATELKGWVRVAWQSRLLGWGKVSNGTLKNHFPKNLRQAVSSS